MKTNITFKHILLYLIVLELFLCSTDTTYAFQKKEDKKKKELEVLQKRFEWWPTDAQPAPIRDEQRGGYWWWPKTPGKAMPWGNRGYIYVYKIIFDYKAEELPAPKPQELRASLLVKKIIKNVKIYFDYDKSVLRSDAAKILQEAVGTLKRNPQASILITGNCDTRGSEAYNEKLGRARAEAIKQFMLASNVKEERIQIVSRGKLDAIAPVTDLVGMQKDRNAQFMVAEVEEVMIPYSGEFKVAGAKPIAEGKYLLEKSEQLESQIQVSTRPYVIKQGDTLRKIAQEQLGGSYRWQYLYEFNKKDIKDPNALEAGTTIIIPVEQEGQGKVTAEPVKAAPAKSQTAAVTRTYTIQKNDSLWKIAKQQLGNGNRWKEIHELNKAKIKNPDKLIPGTKIELPEK